MQRGIYTPSFVSALWVGFVVVLVQVEYYLYGLSRVSSTGGLVHVARVKCRGTVILYVHVTEGE